MKGARAATVTNKTPLQCGCCGKFISPADAAKCKKCRVAYHRTCALLPTSGLISPSWHCAECKKSNEQDMAQVRTAASIRDGDHSDEFLDTSSLTSPPPSGQATSLDVAQEILLFRSELRDFRDELREYRREMAELRTSIDTCNKRVDNIEGRLEALESRQMLSPMDGETAQLELTIAQLKLELNEREQESLCADLEIANLPEEKGENVTHIVGIMASKLGVALQEHDVVFAERVGVRTERSTGGVPTRERRIVVRLARRGLRDELLRSARARRGVTSEGLGLAQPPRRFYLNERLTRVNKHLMYRAREVAGSVGWRYTWSKHGRILAKQGDGKKTYWIRTEQDIQRVFCQDTRNDNSN